MNRTALALVLAAAAAGAAEAQVLHWDTPDFRTPSVRDLVSAQPAPSTPKSAPAAPADAQPAKACPDGAELTGRSVEVTLKIQDAAAPLVLAFAYDHCRVETPRDLPEVPPFTIRAYKSPKGDSLYVYSASDRPTSTLSIRLADGASTASMLPILSTAELASGRTLDLGEILLVRLTNGSGGVVIHAVGAIKTVTAR